MDLLPGVPTVYDNFIEGRKRGGESPMLGTRESINGAPGKYVWESYNQIFERAKNCGAALRKLQLPDRANVGFFSVNRAEWVILEQGCFMYRYQTVPLYDTLGQESMVFIIEQTEMQMAGVTKDKVATLVQLKSKIPTLKTLVIFNAVDSSDLKEAHDAGFEALTFAQFEALGKEAPLPVEPPKRDDIATICYTSGTTGLPKGVVLTHANMVSFCSAVVRLRERGRMYDFTDTDVYISYLPLAHIFERACQVVIIYHGGRIGFYQGETLKLMDDVLELRPTVFVSVPRLYNRIYDKINATIAERGGVAKKLFDVAFSSKKSSLAHGSNTHWLWDRIVFSKVQAKLGGRIRILLTGAAPISPKVMDFLRICFACDVYEGYGQTETTAAVTITDKFDFSSGHVGVPTPHNEIKLVDLPHLNYLTTDKPFPRGEICIRGFNCFHQYYKDPERTKETVNGDGWVRTGDVGMFDAKGRLAVIDRAKNIFKLAQGEYVAPEKVENVLQSHPLVQQAFVTGNSMQGFLVGIIVPDSEMFPKWAKANGFHDTEDFVEVCGSASASKALLKVLSDHGKAHDLKGFEVVKAIHIEPQPFSVENNLLTPTFKLKRHDAQRRYQQEVDVLYANFS